MIQANELRIGNWVEIYDAPNIYKIENGFCQVEAMTIHYMQYKDDIKLCGIPITEDILLKCGFEYRNENRGLGAILDFKNKEFDNWKYDMSVAFQHETDNKEIVYLHFLQHKTTNSIKYLHQLQNLYFALTQKELTIKL